MQCQQIFTADYADSADEDILIRVIRVIRGKKFLNF